MTFTVPDMSCGHCTATIEAAIKAADPSASVTCDLALRQVTVESALSGDAIISAMVAAGYETTTGAA